MIRILNSGDAAVSGLVKRSPQEYPEQIKIVKDIIADVKKNGDKALFKYTEKFDRIKLTSENLLLSEDEIRKAYKAVTPEAVTAVKNAKENILRFSKRLLTGSGKIENGAGYMVRPVERAGVYVPGGTAAYPSSVLMCVLPAVAAGVQDIIMSTPVGRGLNPLVLVAADICGIKKIFQIGGAQAIAAMAYGTESVPKVDVISGPGNIYVALAKREVYGDVGIDMIAGPSEILIIADKSARPDFLAADMLSQAEHDTFAASVLLTTDAEQAKAVQREMEAQLGKLSRESIARAAIENNSAIIITKSLSESFDISNRFAPEHLELCIENSEASLSKVINAGAVFMGNYSPEPVGDYYAGPNHVLPTNGTARYFSSLNADNYVKKISLIKYDYDMLTAAKDDIINIADYEEFTAHANAVKIRFK